MEENRGPQRLLERRNRRSMGEGCGQIDERTIDFDH